MLISFWFCVIFVILCFIYFYNLVYNNEKTRYINRIKGPPQLPFIGNLHHLSVFPDKLFAILRKLNKTYYPVYKLWLSTRPVVFIHHPDDLEILLSSPKHINKKLVYENLKPWMKEGLILSTGDHWHQRRKILTKAFHFRILQKYMYLINKRGHKMIVDINKEGRETSKDLLPFYATHTLDIICESAMGVSSDNPQDKKSAELYKQALHRVANIVVYRVMRPYIQDWMLPFFPKLNKENKEVHYNLDFFTDKIVKERREYHEKTNYASFDHLNMNQTSDFNIDFEDDDVYDQDKKLSMLDLLLESEKNGLIDDAGIKEEVATFVFAGHDTTASSLCFTTMLFAENKDIQNKAREEVEEIFKTQSENIGMSHLRKMTYLERCIKESLRMFPSVPTITRYVSEDVQMKNYTIPKDTNIVVSIFDTHRNPEFWPEPEKFDPDRFLLDNAKKHHPFSYVPFSAGPRNCIGQKFAMMELKFLLAIVLYNFNLEPITLTKDLKFSMDATLHPTGVIYTKFIRINRK